MPELSTLLLRAGSVATLVLLPGPNLIYAALTAAGSPRRS